MSRGMRGHERGREARSGSMEQGKRSHRVPTWARWLLVVAWACFVWSRSLYPGPQSSSQSAVVVALVRPLLEALGVCDESAMSFLVRKAGHFLEYTVLGALLALTRAGGEGPLWPRVLAGVAVPGVDETIQRFVPGRSGQLTDVMLDCCGVAFGMLAVTGIRSARRRCRR